LAEPVSEVEIPRGPASTSKTLGKKSAPTPIPAKTPRKKGKTPGKTPGKTITKLLEKGRKKFTANFTPRADPSVTVASTSQLPAEIPSLADDSQQFVQPPSHPFDRHQANPETVFITDEVELPHARSASTRQFLDLLQLVNRPQFYS